MPRKNRPLKREDGRDRDATLIIVASEDRYTADDYFKRFRTHRAQFVVLPTLDDRSAPQYVMRRLDDFKAEYATEDGDTFWLCIDRDRWDEGSLSEVLQECRQKGYGIAVSNPCFELWILLHHEDLTPQTPCNARGLNERLKELLNGYKKTCCRSFAITQEMVSSAIDRARSSGSDADFIPPAPNTHVYKIMDALAAREPISLA